MPKLDWDTIRDMFKFWYHEPEAFERAYDKGVIQHTPEVEITHKAILEFGNDRKKGSNIWEDKTKYK